MADETPETPENETPDEAATPDAPEATEAVDAPEAAAPAEPAEPETPLTPKERRTRRRAAQSAKRGSGGPRTAEERVAEREARRAANAKQRRAYRAKQKEKRAAARAESPAPEADHAPEHGPGRPKVRQGVVVSDKADKTITVRIDVTRRHKRYHKTLRSSSTLHAHDERNDANAGDTVRVVESRPLSRTKRWRLVEVLERAK